ncbi:Type I iodothyronine deiodinase [Trichoplax sp. H2]|nr:Type I iodothyronine deiodinase [Trichoplax sp. H2]|eukprot:RDD39442.1 Type I iodothyronine deiodinase [Trichoplax sp. H2]
MENASREQNSQPIGKKEHSVINGSIKRSKITYHPITTALLTVYGFLKLIYLRFGGMLFYPSDYFEAANFVDGLFDTAGHRNEISNWNVLKRNLFNTQALVAIAQERYHVVGYPYVGNDAPSIDRYIQLVNRYSANASFLTIYIAEAHASDDWNMPDLNSALGINIAKPKTLEDRIRIAENFILDYNYDIPMYVDSIDNDTMEAYGARPERLYIIVNGKIAYKGGPGPYCFSYSSLEESLLKVLKQL